MDAGKYSSLAAALAGVPDPRHARGKGCVRTGRASPEQSDRDDWERVGRPLRGGQLGEHRRPAGPEAVALVC